uniref:F-box domain-containing protein n=1 Tax=Mycena chlorophos TaxID=658473 RepID=A0ABQ0M720_MYCCL|nr:predicted protein [Mycena chlorophos]
MDSRLPTLPPELEQYIFELAARRYRSSIPAFLRVAQRVHHDVWLQRMLYESLLVDIVRNRPTPNECRPAASDFFASRVRHLCVTSSIREHDCLLALLSSCKDAPITSLALFVPFPNPDFLPYIPPTLTRPTVDVQYLFGGPLKLNLAHPALARITHLDIIQPAYDTWGFWSGLAQMPALTHLAFRDKYLPHVVASVLAQCGGLQAVGVVWSGGKSGKGEDVHRVADWERGVLGEGDFWSRADELILRKTTGQAKASQCWVQGFS